jgi:hypothetical protein
MADTINFTVNADAGNGKITAIRVQDIAKQKWFNWNNGAWDNQPTITPGVANLYIAFAYQNQGGDAAFMIAHIFQDDTVAAFGSMTLNNMESGGLEVTLDMPSGGTAIQLVITP